ncbi:hypothetical protein [Streptomyces sp. NPDC001508]|uniref:hypothetical protein n=1 Tax=Streptomyces sp. NPDC001508 TaxID=3154656 RepID=UPI00332FEBA9
MIDSATRRFLGLPAEGPEGRLAEVGLDPAGEWHADTGWEVRDVALTVGDRLLVVNAVRACAVR